MGLSATIANAVKAGMSAIGDLKDTATAYMVDGEPIYDDEAGTYVTTTLSDSSIDVLLYDFEGHEVTGNVRFQTDQKLLVESRLLVNVTMPEYFGIDGIRWDVIEPMRVPSDAVRIFHVRNTGNAVT